MTRRVRTGPPPPGYPCSAVDLIRFLEGHGFHLVRVATHCKLRDGCGRTIVVPNHPHLAKGTYYRIVSQVSRPS
ncbi:type II toxin-antitoxin system HicA family toxin [Embleya sp. NPDC055664]